MGIGLDADAGLCGGAPQSRLESMMRGAATVSPCVYGRGALDSACGFFAVLAVARCAGICWRRCGGNGPVTERVFGLGLRHDTF